MVRGKAMHVWSLATMNVVAVHALKAGGLDANGKMSSNSNSRNHDSSESQGSIIQSSTANHPSNMTAVNLFSSELAHDDNTGDEVIELPHMGIAIEHANATGASDHVQRPTSPNPKPSHFSWSKEPDCSLPTSNFSSQETNVQRIPWDPSFSQNLDDFDEELKYSAPVGDADRVIPPRDRPVQSVGRNFYNQRTKRSGCGPEEDSPEFFTLDSLGVLNPTYVAAHSYSDEFPGPQTGEHSKAEEGQDINQSASGRTDRSRKPKKKSIRKRSKSLFKHSHKDAMSEIESLDTKHFFGGGVRLAHDNGTLIQDQDQHASNAVHKPQDAVVANQEDIDVTISTRTQNGENDFSRLTRAVLQKNIKDVKTLLESKQIDVNQADIKGWTALHLACEAGFQEIVQQFLEVDKIDVNQITTDGWPALSLASAHGHIEVVQQLLGHKKILVNQSHQHGCAALYVASANGFFNVVELLLRRDDTNVNLLSKDQSVALHDASVEGHDDVVKVLLSHKQIDVNISHPKYSGPLYAACKRGHDMVVRHLLEHQKININVANKNGKTPLHAASEHGRHMVVRQLVDQEKININAITDKGWSALGLASGLGHLDVVRQLLLHSDIDVNQPNSNNLTALYVASEHGQYDVVCELVDHQDTDITKVVSGGQTALHIACAKGHDDVVRQFLLSDSKRKGSSWTSGIFLEALDMACQNKHLQTENLVRQYIYARSCFSADFEDSNQAHMQSSSEPSIPTVNNSSSTITHSLIEYTPVKFVFREPSREFPIFGTSRSTPVGKSTRGFITKFENGCYRIKIKHAADKGKQTLTVSGVMRQDFDIDFVALTKMVCSYGIGRDSIYHFVEQQCGRSLTDIDKTTISITIESLVNEEKSKTEKIVPFNQEYEIIKKIGEGSFGEVFKVRAVKSKDEFYAMKAFKNKFANRGIHNKALQEAAHLKVLSHKNVIEFRGALFKDGAFHLVMEFAHGGDLRQQIKKRKNPWSRDFIIDWFHQILSGLHHLHVHHMIHRDLKPENILVSDSGELKISDLGLSIVVDHSSAKAKSDVGTGLYKAPEIHKGKDYSFQADVWAAGCVLYELSMLKRAFPNVGSIFECKPVIDGFSSDGQNWAGLQNVCARMLSKNSSDRGKCWQWCLIFQHVACAQTLLDSSSDIIEIGLRDCEGGSSVRLHKQDDRVHLQSGVPEDVFFSAGASSTSQKKTVRLESFSDQMTSSMRMDRVRLKTQKIGKVVRAFHQRHHESNGSERAGPVVDQRLLADDSFVDDSDAVSGASSEFSDVQGYTNRSTHVFGALRTFFSCECFGVETHSYAAVRSISDDQIDDPDELPNHGVPLSALKCRGK